MADGCIGPHVDAILLCRSPFPRLFPGQVHLSEVSFDDIHPVLPWSSWFSLVTFQFPLCCLTSCSSVVHSQDVFQALEPSFFISTSFREPVFFLMSSFLTLSLRVIPNNLLWNLWWVASNFVWHIVSSDQDSAPYSRVEMTSDYNKAWWPLL